MTDLPFYVGFEIKKKNTFLKILFSFFHIAFILNDLFHQPDFSFL